MIGCCYCRLLMSGPSLAGLLTVLHACLDMKGTLLDKYHYLLFFLAPSMCPRMLLMLSEEESEGVEEGHGGLNPTPITARVGLAVETIGQAGRRPKTITGFQVPTNCTVHLCGVWYRVICDRICYFCCIIDTHYSCPAWIS